jgi:hypothetical protein
LGRAFPSVSNMEALEAVLDQIWHNLERLVVLTFC